MIWYKNDERGIDEIEIDIDEIKNLPEGHYILVRKGCKLVGGPVIPKSELVEAVENTTLPEGEAQIINFAWNYTNKINN